MPTQNWAERTADTLDRIEGSEAINEHNKALIADYKRDKVFDGFSDATLSRNLNRLKIMSEHLGDENFDDLDKDGVKDLVAWLYEQDYTDGTIDTYKNVIRSFYRWLDPTEDGKTPAQAAWIRMNGGNNGNGTLPKDLLTKDDIKAQIDAAKNPRDRALIAMLYETGARIGEIIDLTVGDIEDRKRGRKVVIDGKTGPRRLPLVECVTHLNDWLSEHPNPEADAPLWCKTQQRGPRKTLDPTAVDDLTDVYGIGAAMAERLRNGGVETGADLVERSPAELADITNVSETTAAKWLKQFDPDATFENENQLGYRYITDKILGATMERAGIDKPSNPHHYRHSRASYLANHMTEAQLCEWFGWVQGSDVPAKYVHLSGRDLDDSYDAMHGLTDPDEDENKPDVIECYRCNELNRPEASFCDRCGFALDQEIAEEVESGEEKVTDEATESDIMLAMKIVEKMREDRDSVEKFVDDLE